LLLCEDGTWAAVEDLLDTGEWETVYNLRVANYHTYFVGCDEWGFSVWAHNAEYASNRAKGDALEREAQRFIHAELGEQFLLAKRGNNNGFDIISWTGRDGLIGTRS